MLKEFNSILINNKASVKEAMKQLDETAEKILFVVEQENKLIGSITDGDIRRWILKEGSITDTVEQACFKNTYCVNLKYDLEEVKKEILARKIVYVPVVDDEKKIIEFLIWDKLFDGHIKRKTKNKLDVPVVIMAGGKGARLDPFTQILPKPLIPIGEKTIIEIIIDKFLEYQVDHFYISVNHKAGIIKSYFKDLQPRYGITYMHEDKPLGTVGALKQLENQLKGALFLTNCDIIVDADYNDLLNHHIQHNNDITIVASVKNFRIPYGICEIQNGGDLKEIREKPEYNFLVNTGMYVLNAEIIKYIPDNIFFLFTELIEKVKSAGLKVGIYPISENAWIDTGEWEEYKKARNKIL